MKKTETKERILHTRPGDEIPATWLELEMNPVLYGFRERIERVDIQIPTLVSHWSSAVLEERRRDGFELFSAPSMDAAESRTKTSLVRYAQENGHTLDAFYRIEEKAKEIGWPQDFKYDLLHDMACIASYGSKIAYGSVIRESGTELIRVTDDVDGKNAARRIPRYIANAYGGRELHWFFWDGVALIACRDHLTLTTRIEDESRRLLAESKARKAS